MPISPHAPEYAEPSRMRPGYVIATPEVRSSLMPGARGDFAENLAALRDLGYETLEVAMRDPDDPDARGVEAAIARSGLPVAMIGSAPSELQDGVMLCHPDASVREAGAARLRALIEAGEKLGAMGVNIGRFRGTCVPGELWEASNAWMRDAMRAGADYAARRGMKIYVEPYNRYETNFVNTVRQGMEYVKAESHPGLALMIDSCWMNSEDASLPGAIFAAGEWIEYVHVADSTRGYPGSGHIHFGDFIRALREIGYEGVLSVQIDQKPAFRVAAERSIRLLRCYL